MDFPRWFEDAAEELAEFTDHDELRFRRLRHISEGEWLGMATCDRALEIQAEWRTGDRTNPGNCRLCYSYDTDRWPDGTCSSCVAEQYER